MSRVAGYAEKFCDKHKGYTDAQLEKVRSELLQELEELSDAEEFHSFQYAEVNWEYDLINIIIKERKKVLTFKSDSDTL